jgi:hypothetical protein
MRLPRGAIWNSAVGPRRVRVIGGSVEGRFAARARRDAKEALFER